MTTSENGIAFIKSNEGFRQFIYMDNGRQAIGYGHDLLPGESFPEGINTTLADVMLRADLHNRFEPPLNRFLVSHNVSLTQNQWDAWVDFSYNLGPADGITMMAHGVDQVPVQMLRWDFKHVNGVPVQDAEILKRRQAELALWNS